MRSGGVPSNFISTSERSAICLFHCHDMTYQRSTKGQTSAGFARDKLLQ
jgi:hypothetical protein